MVQFYQLYDPLVQNKQRGRFILVLAGERGAYYVNGPLKRVEALWITTATSLLLDCKPILKEEALAEISGLDQFLEQVDTGKGFHYWDLQTGMGIATSRH